MKKFIWVLLVAVFLSSCSEYQKAVKSDDVALQFEQAKKMYDAQKYKKAIRLFEYLAPVNKGKPNAEQLFYMFSKSYYNTNQFYLAGFQFESFVSTYPKSENLEEGAFLGAKSYSKLSPVHSLDQTDTYKAIEKMQIFIDRFPNSTYLNEANTIVEELTFKLQRKQYENAKEYNTISDFKSAIVAFDIFINENSGSPYTEDALYYKLDSAYKLAINSVYNKMEERLNVAKKAHVKLLEFKQDTKYLKEANVMLERIEKELKNFTK